MLEHPDGVASFVAKLKGIRRISEGGVLLDRLEATIPDSAVDALVDALEHPERVRFVGAATSICAATPSRD